MSVKRKVKPKARAKQKPAWEPARKFYLRDPKTSDILRTKSGNPRMALPRLHRKENEGKTIIGYKKVWLHTGDKRHKLCIEHSAKCHEALRQGRSHLDVKPPIIEAVAILRIDGETPRCQPGDFKCRAKSATVLEIIAINDSTSRSEGYSGYVTRADNKRASPDDRSPYLEGEYHGNTFKAGHLVYRVGETVSVPKFKRSSQECDAGIHFFLTFKEARHYGL